MKTIQNRRTQNTEKSVPGCLGKVANFFDLSTGVAENRRLTDKPYFDGFGHSRCQLDAMRVSPIGDALDDEVVAYELAKSSSKRNNNATSVKMLMAEEMSKELELKQNSPNLVAKLMGLDSLPQKKPDLVSKRGHSRSYSGSHIVTELDSWQQEHRSLEKNKYKEFPDMTRLSRKGKYMREKVPERGRCIEDPNEKKMDFVRKKFVEAKKLATNEKLRQSKQYEDALEVLTSNRELFLKLLEEQNSFIPKNKDFHYSSPPPNTKRITVLRPSKILDDKMNARPIKKAVNMGQVNKIDKRNNAFSPNCRLDEIPYKPTRIVVLKPSGKPHNAKAVVSPSPLSPRENGKKINEEYLDNEILESREMAKRNSSGHRREQTLNSSVFSNGYSGDESSFHKSENEFNFGNLSDSEAVTPTSRHTWDYIHSIESPFGSSSFSHDSCSPESSVCKEAKKRLSERWTLMASNGNYQEKRNLWRSSSTLGEMLSLSHVLRSEGEGIIEEQEARESPLCSTNNLNIDQFMNDSPRNILRSTSVPASSTVFVDKLNKVLDPKVAKSDIINERAKTSTPKSSSFKEKFSSLFFSRNKKPSKDNFSLSQSKLEWDKPAKMVVPVPEKKSEGIFKDSCVMEEDKGPPDNLISQDQIGKEKKTDEISSEAKLCVTKPLALQIPGENQDQPSPISVLEPLFGDDDNITTNSSNIEGNKYGSKLVAHSINESLPEESIARTLTWDDPCIDTTISYLRKPSRVSQVSEGDEQELILFVKSLLSAAGFNGRWHSAESPLDPSLRENYLNTKVKDVMDEPKRKKNKSTQKLVFDCVNTALVEITGYGLAERRPLDREPSMLVEEVWAHLKGWLPCEISEDDLNDDLDKNGFIVEATVKKEMMSKVWSEYTRLENDDLGKEIEAILLEELVEELVVEFSGRV